LLGVSRVQLGQCLILAQQVVADVGEDVQFGRGLCRCRRPVSLGCERPMLQWLTGTAAGHVDSGSFGPCRSPAEAPIPAA
jgi:hypothetical protein